MHVELTTIKQVNNQELEKLKLALGTSSFKVRKVERKRKVLGCLRVAVPSLFSVN